MLHVLLVLLTLPIFPTLPTLPTLTKLLYYLHYQERIVLVFLRNLNMLLSLLSYFLNDITAGLTPSSSGSAPFDSGSAPSQTGFDSLFSFERLYDRMECLSLIKHLSIALFIPNRGRPVSLCQGIYSINCIWIFLRTIKKTTAISCCLINV